MNMKTLSSRKARCLLYARVSSKEQEREGYSIDAQLKLLRDYAQNQGFEVVQEFQEAESAKDSGRAQFNAMLRFLEVTPHVRHVLCEKTDRLSRNFKDIATLDALINEKEIVVHLVKENAQLSKDSRSHEKFMFGIKALMAKNYTDNLSEEVKKGMREKANQGEYPGGTIPYGYIRNRETGRIEIDKTRAHYVREIFELYASNKMSLRALAVYARSRSLTTPRSGRPITMCQIERILKNPFYCGEFRWAGKLYQGTHERLISRELYEETQRAFKRHDKPLMKSRQHAFGSLMTCSKCGCKITAEFKKGRYTYYHCTGMRGGCDMVYVKEEDLISQFEDLNGPLVLTKDQADQIMFRLSRRHASSASRIKAEQRRIQVRLSQLDTWTEKAYLDKLQSNISEDHWKRLSLQWETERVNLRAQLENLEGDHSDILPTAERILELAQKLPAIWVKRNPAEKRQIVDLLYWNCHLDGATLSAAYRKPFDIIAEGHQTKNKRG